MNKSNTSFILTSAKYLEAKVQETSAFFSELTHLEILYAGFTFLLFIWTYLFIRLELHLYNTVCNTIATNLMDKRKRRRSSSAEINLNVLSERETESETIPDEEKYENVKVTVKNRQTKNKKKKKTLKNMCSEEQQINLCRYSYMNPAANWKRNFKRTPWRTYIDSNKNCIRPGEPIKNHDPRLIRYSTPTMPLDDFGNRYYLPDGLCSHCAKFGTCLHTICMDIFHNCRECFDKTCIHSTKANRR